MSSWRVCCEMAQIVQPHAQRRSDTIEPSMPYFSRILPRTMTAQQRPQQITGIRSPMPQSWPSTVAFCWASWHVPHNHERAPAQRDSGASEPKKKTA
jgi:hypothetical protein